ncbi:MAG: endonuclease III [Clostridia bacterium]|nr:endonuclease III [Clostridia bacterium]
MHIIGRPENKVEELLCRLVSLYPNAKPGLNFTNPYQLLIATILSAQCTDERVNKVTEKLFARYPNPKVLADACQEELAAQIRECGLFRNKSKNIIAACRLLMDDYDGQVPACREALEKLPGVGRKTASVVLSNAFGIPAIAVDTHVFRVANRLGLANAKDVLAAEKQLQQNIPEELWSQAHHWLIYHGRQVCKARKPACEKCNLKDLCGEAISAGR